MPFDNSNYQPDDEVLGVRAGAAPFAKLLTPPPATDEVLRCLIEARRRLSDPARWSKGCFFRGANGWNLDTDDLIDDAADAMNWSKVFAACAWGILRIVANESEWASLAVLDSVAPNRCAVSFNDDPSTTHADVRALFDRAISARRAALVSA